MRRNLAGVCLAFWRDVSRMQLIAVREASPTNICLGSLADASAQIGESVSPRYLKSGHAQHQCQYLKPTDIHKRRGAPRD
jgi:hypothetical protein